MRADEKIDPELELEQAPDQVEALEEEEAADEQHVDEVDTSAMHFHELVAYIEGLLHGQSVDLAHLEWLSDVERQGIALVTEAIVGRSSTSIKALLAEERLQMLNQALAALQPALAAGFEGGTLEGRDLYRALVDEVAAFKHGLESLTDAQEEVFVRDEMRAAREGADDGKPKPKPVDAGEVGDERPTTLVGPGPAVEKPAIPTTLVGPGPAVEKPAAVTTLTGPGAAPEKKPQPSAAWDGDDRSGR